MKKGFDKRFLELKRENDLCQAIDCTPEENQKILEMIDRKEEIPFNIYQKSEFENNEFVRITPLQISSEEIQEYCALKNAKNINTIKNCLVFFTVITVIGMIFGLLSVLPILLSFL